MLIYCFIVIFAYYVSEYSIVLKKNSVLSVILCGSHHPIRERSSQLGLISLRTDHGQHEVFARSITDDARIFSF